MLTFRLVWSTFFFPDVLQISENIDKPPFVSNSQQLHTNILTEVLFYGQVGAQTLEDFTDRSPTIAKTKQGANPVGGLM